MRGGGAGNGKEESKGKERGRMKGMNQEGRSGGRKSEISAHILTADFLFFIFFNQFFSSKRRINFPNRRGEESKKKSLLSNSSPIAFASK